MDKNITKKLSICIPTTELKYSDGTIMGVYMLNSLFKSIDKQTYKDFEIIISDHSPSDIIKEECDKWSNLDIKYYKNTSGIGSAAKNLNFAITKASGEYIKTIFQDDYFHSPEAIEYIMTNIGDSSWGAVGTYHCYEDNTSSLVNPISPSWNDPIQLLGGLNTISGPSVIFFKNDNNFFDENLGWLNDVEFYYRLFIKYGLPLLLPKHMILQRLRNEGVSNVLNDTIKIEEKKYVFAKHNITGDSKNLKDYPEIYNRINKLK
jgi:glycosyltransferase involved in cell wall biosynthesis